MTQPSDILREYIERDDIVAGRYVVDHQIGAGAYGAIYLAFDRNTHEEVAIKALPPRGEGSSDTAIGRFERELKVVRNLSHRNIVELTDYGETDDDILFMVMEYIEGETLEDTILGEGALPIEESLSIARQIASALDAAHAVGVIHRDLKPANIMLVGTDGGFRVKILDFGMAKLFARLGDESIVALTREGVAVGTPRYIAPEQARGSKRVGPWTDLYALGLLIYEMITGTKAVSHDSVESAVAEHVDPEPLELPNIEQIPPPVRRLIRQLVSKRIEDRLSSAADVVQTIDDLSEFDVPTPATRSGPPESVTTSPPPDSVKGGPAARPGAASGPPPDGTTEEESLELDWDRYDGGAPAGGFPSEAEVNAELSDRLLRGGIALASVLAAIFMALASFMAITAQFHEFEGAVRGVVGALPVIIACFSAWSSADAKRARKLVRDTLMFCAGGFLVVHVIGPERLAKELWNDPVWFLEPFRHIGVVDQLANILAGMGQSYATFLMSIFGSGGGFGT